MACWVGPDAAADSLEDDEEVFQEEVPEKALRLEYQELIASTGNEATFDEASFHGDSYRLESGEIKDSDRKGVVTGLRAFKIKLEDLFLASSGTLSTVIKTATSEGNDETGNLQVEESPTRAVRKFTRKRRKN